MRAAQAVMADLAAAGLTAAQLALVIELSTAVAVEARPVEDKAAQRRRSKDREYQAEKREERRQNRQISADSADDAPPPNERDNLTLPQDTHSDEASASSPARQPISEAKDFWNEAASAVGWPTVQTLSPTRQRCLGARLRQHGIDGWRAAINRARLSPYLAGADPPSWFTFNWIIKAENFLKLTEGNYDRRNTDTADPTSVALARVQQHFRNRQPLGGIGEDAETGGAGIHECRPASAVVGLRC